MPHLLIFFLLPFVCAIAAFCAGSLPAKIQKGLAVGFSLIPLLGLILGWNNILGSEVQYAWLPSLGIEFHLRIDNLSLIFVSLTAIVVPISLLAVRSETLTYSSFFYGLVLLTQGLLIGFFTSRDLVLFTLFFEGMLLPLYFIINLWGGPKRQSASIRFLIYMIAGSCLMIAAVLFLYVDSGTFNLDKLPQIASASPHAPWLCAIFLLAFAVKTPLFPFHAWLPDAYCQAPTAGSILLAGLLSKAGIYGILRVVMELFPSLILQWSPFLLSFAIAGVLYGAFAAWVQKDFKRLIAYSSFSHVNFILVGLFVWNETAHSGAILQAFNHGITITSLFLVAGWLEQRLGTTEMGGISGLAKFMPHLCWLTLFFVLSSVALPGLNNFVGELLIFYGLFGFNPWMTALLGLSVIFSVVYMLRFMLRIYFDEPGYFKESWTDIHAKEFAIALPLVLLMLWIGIYPAPMLDRTNPAAEKTIAIANERS